MAKTQKKDTNKIKKDSSAGKGNAKKQRSSRTAKETVNETVKTKQTSTKRPYRRELGAAACLVLALFSTFGFFKIEALFIDLFCGLAKGILGYGYWILPLVLLMSFYILAFHRGRPVCLRVTCALMLPLVFGIMLHLFLAEEYSWGGELAKNLWYSGREMQSGGVLGGVIAILCDRLFSAIGTAIILFIAAMFMILVACDKTLMDVVEYLRNRPHLEYEREEDPLQIEAPAPRPVSVPVNERPRRKPLDIPVEDGPLLNVRQEELLATAKKGGFFNNKPNVKTPDQVLAEENILSDQTKEMDNSVSEVPAAQSESQVTAPVPLDLDEESESVTPIPEIVREPAVPKVSRKEAEQAAQEVAKDIAETMEQENKPYQYPPLSLLNEDRDSVGSETLSELNLNKSRLADTLHSFGIDASIVNVIRGPSVTRYELELDQGVRLNKLTKLADDIALALGAKSVRIAPIPDKISIVGIEVPNKLVSPVSIHNVIGSKEFTGSTSKVSFAVGKDIGGNCIVGNIAKLPHLLIAGTTGSGKSVCTNSLITSLLYKATPDEVRLIMVDPKMVELGVYSGIPHLLIPVVTDPKKAAGALQWAVTEMMKRYRAFSEVGARDLAAYNAKAARTDGMEKMPQIVIIIDELADLMLVAAKEVEESICRVAQMGRASGMHLVIATQRPSADVITGLMKANIPSRIAFAVASAMESRIILDNMGAEKLVGKGDMLYAPLGQGKPQRVQGCFISDEEVARVAEFVKKSGQANYSDEIMHEIEQHAAAKDKNAKGVCGSAPESVDDSFDELLPSAIEVVVETGQASVSMLQRRLKLGYARAARLVDQMEEKGIVGPFEGSKPRQLLITKDQWQEMQYRQNMSVSPADAQSSEAKESTVAFDAEEALDNTEEVPF